MSEAAKPDVAVITNIGSSHLEALGSRENIRRAKMEITAGLKDGGTLFLNGDEPLLQGHESDRYNVVYFGMKNEECDYFASNVRSTEAGLMFDMRSPLGEYKNIEINVVGAHNVYNAMAAFSIGLKMDMNEADIRAGLLDYVPAGMRQNIYSVAGITVIEDCYNASPDSMQAALTTLKDYPCTGRRIAVLADMLELGHIAEESHWNIGKLAAECADVLYCFGPMGKCYAQGAGQNGLQQVNWFETKADLAAELCRQVKPGDVVWGKASRGMKLEEVLHILQVELEK
jgi:UDP-N-acetylmuramoyl-tripeptide--D-alanyl-D-alanine ligase